MNYTGLDLQLYTAFSLLLLDGLLDDLDLLQDRALAGTT